MKELDELVDESRALCGGRTWQGTALRDVGGLLVGGAEIGNGAVGEVVLDVRTRCTDWSVSQVTGSTQV